MARPLRIEYPEAVYKVTIKLAHSPDADDAFMFYGLAQGFVQSKTLEFQHILSDIETLNQKALKGVYEVTALSVHAYAYVNDRYDILLHGASIGDQYGPILVSREPLKPSELEGRKIAVPGTLTTAYLALKLFNPNLETLTLPFNQIIQAVEAGKVDVGLLIHEGQLTFTKNGLHKIIDLGVWWHEQTGLPLPLGVNGIRKDLDPSLKKEIARLVKASITYGLEHRPDALKHALQFARGIGPNSADQFVGMYVNEETIEMSGRTQKAIQILLDQAVQASLIPQKIAPRYF